MENRLPSCKRIERLSEWFEDASNVWRRLNYAEAMSSWVAFWAFENGAQYTFLATEEKNVASRNLFTLKCNYIKSSSLVLYLQPLSFPSKNPSQLQDIKIERLSLDHAISIYNNYLRSKDIYPADIDSILKDELSLGSWVSYFKEEGWINGLMDNKEKKRGHEIETPRSWALFSIWNTSEAYKIQVKSSHEPKFFHSNLSQARDKIFSCLKMQRSSSCQSLEKPFGFLLLYGIHGEGERVGDLMESIWGFASRLAENLENCKAIMVELGVFDPVREFVPKESTMSCIDDIWYFKRVINGPGYGRDGSTGGAKAGTLMGNVFVDPRDF
ncbi:hypothetical protein U1Q18_015821 [Sarracenia purpurea var. burkii]